MRQRPLERERSHWRWPATWRWAPSCWLPSRATGISTAPLYGGDTRLNAWALAWVDHAVLDRTPVFDANIFFPALNTLAYSEHLLGISLVRPPGLCPHAQRRAVLQRGVAALVPGLRARRAMRWPGGSLATASRHGSAGWHMRSASTACCTGTRICSCSGPAGFLSRSSSSNDGGARRRGRVSCRCGWSCWCRC